MRRLLIIASILCLCIDAFSQYDSEVLQTDSASNIELAIDMMNRGTQLQTTGIVTGLSLIGLGVPMWLYVDRTAGIVIASVGAVLCVTFSIAGAALETKGRNRLKLSLSGNGVVLKF